MELTNSVIISLGSNLGNRFNYLKDAINELSIRVGEVCATSIIYETSSWGFESDKFFLNMCVEVRTNLTPQILLVELKSIEADLGREKAVGPNYSSREIDLDIILFDQLVFINDTLSIPHLNYTKRRFVLQPLNDIASNRMDPITCLTIAQLLANCTDSSEIQCYLNEI